MHVFLQLLKSNSTQFDILYHILQYIILQKVSAFSVKFVVQRRASNLRSFPIKKASKRCDSARYSHLQRLTSKSSNSMQHSHSEVALGTQNGSWADLKHAESLKKRSNTAQNLLFYGFAPAFPTPRIPFEMIRSFS